MRTTLVFMQMIVFDIQSFRQEESAALKLFITQFFLCSVAISLNPVNW